MMKRFGKITWLGAVALAAPLMLGSVGAKAEIGEMDYCNPVYDKATFPTDIPVAQKVVRSKLSGTVVRHKGSVPCTDKPAMTPNTEFLVFFDWNKDKIRPDAAEIIKTAAATAAKIGARSVSVVGHTDTSGTNKYNQGLSERRADAVVKELARDGVAKTGISATGRGENELMTPTADGVREATNRRAVIVLNK